MLAVSDLDSVLSHTKDLWEPLRRKNIFLTGGTGFIGKWLIESFIHANETLRLEANLHVLSRNPKQFLLDHPWLAERRFFHLIEGEIRSFVFPQTEFSHIVHGATSIADPLSPIETFDTILAGTKHLLEFAKRSNASRFLFLSSGAVYGRQPSSLERIPESFSGAPATNLTKSSYGEAKRAAEWLAFETGKTYHIDTCVARCFSFIGPYLPLDKHFAIGNFIRDGMKGDAIRVSGDGTPMRSYLYASDLSIWLWTILMKGHKNEAYNVGSDEGITIKDLAHLVGKISPGHPRILVAKAPELATQPERYVPSIEKAKKDLGLKIVTPLNTGIQKTMKWIEGLQ